MGTFEDLKNAISSVIKENGNGEITGEILQQTLLSMVNVLGEYATFVGVATPDTNPGTPEQNVFYIAAQSGIYPNFNAVNIEKGEFCILSNKTGSWAKRGSVHFLTQETLTDYQEKLISGQNIKTINGNSILGPGNIEITGGGSADNNLRIYAMLEGSIPSAEEFPAEYAEIITQMREHNMGVYNTIAELITNRQPIPIVVFDFKFYYQIVYALSGIGGISYTELLMQPIIIKDSNDNIGMIFREIGFVRNDVIDSLMFSIEEPQAALDLIGGYMLNDDGSLIYSHVGNIYIPYGGSQLSDEAKQINLLSAKATNVLTVNAFRVVNFRNDIYTTDWVNVIATNHSVYWFALYADNNGVLKKLIMDYDTGEMTIENVIN